MRHLALADITEANLSSMLAENETLFVEHKGGLGGQGFQIAKAVCSFANTLGGWVLVGVTAGQPNAGEPGGWEPVGAHEMTDRVREALRSSSVDPLPPFAATVLDYGDPPKPIGVVRVYESSDTPHVMGNGQVFVRSVAEDTDARRKYRAGGVETQAVLVTLAERGSAGVARAREKFDPDRVPLAAMMAGVSGSSFATATEGRIGVRACAAQQFASDRLVRERTGDASSGGGSPAACPAR
jgi:Putative DNA-binding domain